MKIIIGLVSTNKAGKSTVAVYLKEKYQAVSLKFSDSLFEILRMYQIETSRENLQKLSTLLRANFGEDILAKEVFGRIAGLEEKIIIIDGIRRFPDIELAKNFSNFVLIVIDADPKIRWQRAVQQNEKTGDSQKFFEQFLQEENQESESQIKTVMQSAQYFINNNGTPAELYQQIEEILEKIKDRYAD